MQGLSLSSPERPAGTAAAMAAIERAYGAWTLAAVTAISAARLLWLAMQSAGLYPDEAQYWFWAKRLAFGYYSKPPLVAWVVALTTKLAGDGEFEALLDQVVARRR